MEDISRELEKEIAKAKPAPYKAKKERKIVIIDDYGEMRPGGYLKTLVNLLLIISLAGVLGTGTLYYLYSQAKNENAGLVDRLSAAEKKAERMTRDKEILMARMVMAGKDVELASAAVPEPKAAPQKEATRETPLPSKETQPGMMAKPKEEKAVPPPKLPEPTPEETPAETQASVPEVPKPSLPEVEVPNDMVAVEKFLVSRGNTSGKLSVRFNIRNISKTSKEISGRIFAVMKTDTGAEEDWVVVPGGQMVNGMPTPYKKGQYFSITRFKPVKFTINSEAAPDSFKTATVYIFSDDEKLLYKNSMAINGVE